MVLDLMLPALMYSPDYSMADIRAIQRGMRLSLRALHHDIEAFNVEALLGDFPLPFIAIHGARNLVNPLPCVQAAVRLARAAHVELIVMPDAGHLVEFTAVEKVATHLRHAAALRPHVTGEGPTEPTPSAN